MELMTISRGHANYCEMIMANKIENGLGGKIAKPKIKRTNQQHAKDRHKKALGDYIPIYKGTKEW